MRRYFCLAALSLAALLVERIAALAQDPRENPL
jgi:hypothetical protein